MRTEPLLQGYYYHIYNRGNNGEDLFLENDNYLHFLRLYEKYINPVADTFAWCLMKNHFHILVYIKEDPEINKVDLSYSTVDHSKEISPSKQFSHLFNAYSQAINKRYKRTGSLFEKPFARKKVTSDNYFSRLIYYIHHNPVHHGFEKRIIDYPWSSYRTIISSKPTKLQREKTISYFEDITNFKYFHNQEQELDEIKDLLIDYR